MSVEVQLSYQDACDHLTLLTGGHIREVVLLTQPSKILLMPDFQVVLWKLGGERYMELANQCIGSEMFRFLYSGEKNGVVENIVHGGKDSCAYFVSNIFAFFHVIPDGCATVKSLLHKLQAAGRAYQPFTDVTKVPLGAVIHRTSTAENDQFTSSNHIGFFAWLDENGQPVAISNSSYECKITLHPLFWTHGTMLPVGYLVKSSSQS